LSPWSKEIWRLVALLGLALIIGFISGQPLACLLAALALYLGWHIYNIHRLAAWLSKPGKFHPPEGQGVWAEIFNRIYHLQKKNRDRKKKLGKYITRFKESTAAMPDATVVLNAYDQIEWVNKAAQEYLGLQPAKDIGQYVSNLIRHPGFIRYLKLKQYDNPLEVPSPVDEQQQLSVRVIPYGQNQRLLIARDVTRLKRLEEMRRDFVSNISHELRTPLTVIHGYLESMQDESDEALAEWRDTLDMMMRQSGRMQNIVNDLLMLSRLENEELKQASREEVPVPALLNSLREEAIALGTEKEHTVTLECDNELGLYGIQNELYSAFSNLVFNAVRYTPKGGRITIRWYHNASGAHLEVEDTGIGIPPQHLPRLTERFFRVDVGRSREIGGTGLGLAIVKHILERHQAKLRIKSQVNQGSTFICDFPADNVVIYSQQSAAKI
jgi:two-component system phosphate regulon sensor histidine kinase PhoR